MGGARPKTTVEADQALWLAKFPAPSETWNQPRVEHGLLLQRCCSKLSGNSVPFAYLRQRVDRWTSARRSGERQFGERRSAPLEAKPMLWLAFRKRPLCDSNTRPAA